MVVAAVTGFELADFESVVAFERLGLSELAKLVGLARRSYTEFIRIETLWHILPKPFRFERCF